MQIFPKHPSAPDTTEWLKKRLREALTLHRFATLPHYDENPA